MGNLDYGFYISVMNEMVEKKIFRWTDIKERIQKTKHRPEDWNDVRVVLKDYISRGIIERDYLDMSIEQYIIK